jgi:hypothetical protein
VTLIDENESKILIEPRCGSLDLGRVSASFIDVHLKLARSGKTRLVTPNTKVNPRSRRRRGRLVGTVRQGAVRKIP